MKKKYGSIISHTHWDREWYQTFQGYRKRLVHMVDDLIDTMENDQNYKYFFFDGQTIVLEDYLQIRTENKERLAKLIREGRIKIGPWYCMPDEFLISGESIIRNLMKGHRIARQYGVNASKIGYVCDVFGHNSQFPQILHGFDINYAVISRGIKDNSIPAEVYWESPDGSKVLAIKLDAERSYSDFYFAIRWPFDGREYDKQEIIDRMRKHMAYKEEIQVSNVYLLMDGVDHIEVEPKLPWIIDILNEAFPDIEFYHDTLEGFFSKLEKENKQFPVIKGELLEPGYRGLNNQVLSNVWSSRTDIKKNNDFCQEELTKWAEPLSVFCAWNGKQYPYKFINLAWEYLMKNHPHDSICGCSIGQVHKDMDYRFDQARLLAGEVVNDSIKYIVDNINTEHLKGDRTVTVFNNSEIDDERVYEVELFFDRDETPENIFVYDENGEAIPYQTLDKYQKIAQNHEFRRLIDFNTMNTVRIALKLAIPSMGYRTLSYEFKNTEYLKHGDYTYKEFVQPVRYLGTMKTAENTIENEYLKVKINSNGTISVTDKENNRRFSDLLLVEDRGEVGDGWNYRRPLRDSVYTSIGMRANISIEYDGIYMARARINYTMEIPKGIERGNSKRSMEMSSMGVTHEITLKKSSKQLDIKTIINNKAKDHIVKILFPTRLNTGCFYTDTPFDVVKRTFLRPDRSNYKEIDTGVSPSQGFMKVEDAENGIAVFTKGIYEYEAYNNSDRTLALTLLRCFSNEVGTLGGINGQMLGENEFEYAIRFYTPKDTKLYKEYNHFKAGIKYLCDRKHSGRFPCNDSFVKVNNPNIIISSIKRTEDNENEYVIRVFNQHDKAINGIVEFRNPIASCCIANLNEDSIGECKWENNKVTFTISEKRIMTFKVAFLCTKQ